ncbi:hypothetical protein GCM10022284_37320 [Streptomyces hundungensis]
MRVGRIRRMRGERDSGTERPAIRARASRQRAGGTVSPQASMTEVYRTRSRNEASATPKQSQYQAGRRLRRITAEATTSVNPTVKVVMVRLPWAA